MTANPDGGWVAFVGENPQRSAATSIFTVEVSSGRTRQLTDHPASDRTPRWSSDGRWIAFVVSWEAGTEQVAIVPARGGAPLQLTIDRNAHTDLSWSPDSQHIAYSTQRSDDHRFSAAIGVIDINSGQSYLVEQPAGANERTPRFSPDGRSLAFVSDRDGADSLWLYDIQQGTTRKLDFGRGEVSHPAWSPDAGRIAFSFTRGVWSRIGCVGLDDERVDWWSPPTGSAFWPAWSPDGRLLAYAWSDGVTPKEIWGREVEIGDRQQLTFTAPSELPRDVLVRPKQLVYQGKNGLEIEALLYQPTSEKKSGGGILLVHGGPNWVTRELFDPFLQYLVAEEGHTILAPNVRGSTGYGLEFMELNMGDYGGLDQQDWVAGVETLVQVGGVERDRIAIWGRSYGGFASMLSLCQFPDTFRCGVAQFGVSDWHSL